MEEVIGNLIEIAFLPMSADFAKREEKRANEREGRLFGTQKPESPFSGGIFVTRVALLLLTVVLTFAAVYLIPTVIVWLPAWFKIITVSSAVIAGAFRFATHPLFLGMLRRSDAIVEYRAALSRHGNLLTREADELRRAMDVLTDVKRLLSGDYSQGEVLLARLNFVRTIRTGLEILVQLTEETAEGRNTAFDRLREFMTEVRNHKMVPSSRSLDALTHDLESRASPETLERHLIYVLIEISWNVDKM